MVAHRRQRSCRFKVQGSRFKVIIPLNYQLSVLNCDVAHRRQRSCRFKVQAPHQLPRGGRRSPLQLPQRGERRRRGKVQGSRGKGIVYTPTLPHSYTPKNLSLFTCHFSLVTFHLSLFTCHLSLVTYHLKRGGREGR